jgi:hypothetical protein
MSDEIKRFLAEDYRHFQEALDYQRDQISILRSDIAALNTENTKQNTAMTPNNSNS